jgi:hypothetical protein
MINVKKIQKNIECFSKVKNDLGFFINIYCMLGACFHNIAENQKDYSEREQGQMCM